jgi:hypothetical protein
MYNLMADSTRGDRTNHSLQEDMTEGVEGMVEDMVEGMEDMESRSTRSAKSPLSRFMQWQKLKSEMGQVAFTVKQPVPFCFGN